MDEAKADYTWSKFMPGTHFQHFFKWFCCKNAHKPTNDDKWIGCLAMCAGSMKELEMEQFCKDLLAADA